METPLSQEEALESSESTYHRNVTRLQVAARRKIDELLEQQVEAGFDPVMQKAEIKENIKPQLDSIRTELDMLIAAEKQALEERNTKIRSTLNA